MVLDEVPPPVVVLSVTTLMSYPDGKLLPVADGDGDGVDTLARPNRCTRAAANRRSEAADRLLMVTLVVLKFETVASGVAAKSDPRGVT